MKRVTKGIRILLLFLFICLLLLIPYAAYLDSLFLNGDFWHFLGLCAWEWVLFGMGLSTGYIYCAIYNKVRK